MDKPYIGTPGTLQKSLRDEEGREQEKRTSSLEDVLKKINIEGHSLLDTLVHLRQRLQPVLLPQLEKVADLDPPNEESAPILIVLEAEYRKLVTLKALVLDIHSKLVV